MTRTVVRAGFSLIAGWIVLSACGVGTEGLGFGPADDAATPEGSTGNPGASDSPALADDAEASPGDDGSPETASPGAEASDAIVSVGPDATSGGSDANDAISDANDAAAPSKDASNDATGGNEAASEAASDASGDVGATPEASSGDDAASDAGSDANACVLAAGATMCCGSVSCTDHGGSCSTPGICASCQTCTPARPICCALGGPTVKCEVKVTDC